MSSCIKDLYNYDLTKKCTKGGNISMKSNFHKNSSYKDRLYAACKTCRKKSSKKYYNDNRDLILDQKKIIIMKTVIKLTFRETNIQKIEIKQILIFV